MREHLALTIKKNMQNRQADIKNDLLILGMLVVLTVTVLLVKAPTIWFTVFI